MWNLVHLKYGPPFMTPKVGTSAQQLQQIQQIIRDNHPHDKLICIKTVFSI
jgi:hypothetical protein